MQLIIFTCVRLVKLQMVDDVDALVEGVLEVDLHPRRKLSPAPSGQMKRGLLDFNQVVGVVGSVDQEPNLRGESQVKPLLQGVVIGYHGV